MADPKTLGEIFAIPDHVTMQNQPRVEGYFLQIYLDDELTDGEWIEVNQSEGWGVRYKRDENGVPVIEDDSWATERVEGDLTVGWGTVGGEPETVEVTLENQKENGHG